MFVTATADVVFVGFVVDAAVDCVFDSTADVVGVDTATDVVGVSSATDVVSAG